jgi:hypothetical protein
MARSLTPRQFQTLQECSKDQDSFNRLVALVNSTDDIIFTLDQDMKHTQLYGRWIESAGVNAGYERAPEWWNATEHWATWAAKADQQMDIAAAIRTIAEEYADDIKGLVALYCLTTQVCTQTAIASLGLKHSMVYIRMAEIKLKLQKLLADYAPIQPRTWEERYHGGETAPLERIRQRYHDTPLALKAIDTLITGANLKRTASDEKERKMLMYYRKKCSRQIAAAYGQAAAF